MRTFNAQSFSRQAVYERPRGVERFMVAIVFVFASGLFDPRIVPDLGIFRINDIFVSLAAGFGVALVFTKFRSGLKQFSSHSLALIFIFYFFVGLSIFWSYSPISAIARYVGFTLITLWSLYLASRFDVQDLLVILLQTMLTLAVITLITSIALPDIGQMHEYLHKGDWKGIYEQKNTTGRVMTVLVFVSMFCLIFTGSKRLGLAGLLIGGVVLFFTGSRTAGGLALLAIGCVLLLFIRRRPWVIALIVMGGIFLVLSLTLQTLIAGNPLFELGEESISLLQADIPFTGRFGLWQFSIKGISDKPWFGYGFDGFWKINEFGGQLVLEEGWVSGDAHNGIIDTLLQTGVVGVGLFFVIYFFFLGRGVRRIKLKNVNHGDLFATLMIFIFLLANITESYLLKATNIFQLLFTYSLVLLSKPLQFSSDLDSQDEDALSKSNYIDERPPYIHSQTFRNPPPELPDASINKKPQSKRSFLRQKK